MPGSRGFNPVQELRLFIRALRGVRDNPLYIYARTTNTKSATTLGRMKASAINLFSGFGLACLALGALLIPGGWQFIKESGLTPVFRGLAYLQSPGQTGSLTYDFVFAGMILMILPLYLGWLLLGLMRAMQQALGVLGPRVGKHLTLHLSDELAATQLSGYEVLAAAVARICPGLLWRLAAGFPLTVSLLLVAAWRNLGLAEIGYQNWLAHLQFGYRSARIPPDFPSQLPELAGRAIYEGLIIMLVGMLTALLLFMLCIVVGLGMRSKLGVNCFVGVGLLAQLAWLGPMAGDHLTWSGGAFEWHGDTVVFTFCFVAGMLGIAIYYLMLLIGVIAPRLLAWLGYLLLAMSAGMAWFTFLDGGASWYVIDYLMPGVSWVASPFSIYNQYLAHDALIDWGWQEYQSYSMWSDWYRAPLLMLLQLTFLAVLIRFASGVVLLKKRGGAGASLRRKATHPE